jgi:hypothetical protein
MRRLEIERSIDVLPQRPTPHQTNLLLDAKYIHVHVQDIFCIEVCPAARIVRAPEGKYQMCRPSPYLPHSACHEFVPVGKEKRPLSIRNTMHYLTY